MSFENYMSIGYDDLTSSCTRNLEDSWFGPWRCVLLGEWSNCKQLDLVHKKLVQDLKSKCKVDIDESLLKVILGGSKYAFEGGAYVSQLCFKKGCYIGKAGCSEEEKCLTSPGEYNGIEKQSELAFQLIHEAVNELEGLCSVNREPIILVLDFEIQYRARKDTYTQMELDEVREELASHVLEWLFD
ncbi:hypothetical protein CerSpe_213200 [Prunus speciosa]